MLTTRFTDLVGCRVPIQLAAMGGGVNSVDLVAAVGRAGGLGMLATDSAEALLAAVDAVERADATPVGVNFLGPFLDPGAVEAVAPRVRLVEVFWAEPDAALVDLVHAGGALAGWQVGSVDEARAARDAGCDLVVAQGVEAGGHVRGTVGLLPLLDGVLDAVDVPVVAAGGIATGRGMAAALAAGADAVRVGTRFLATPEADVHTDYQRALVAASAEDTALTTAFDLGWPDAPHRVLRAADAAAGAGRSPLPPTRAAAGDVGAMALYAGQSVGAVHEVVAAGDVVRRLCDDAEALLSRWGPDDGRRSRG